MRKQTNKNGVIKNRTQLAGPLPGLAAGNRPAAVSRVNSFTCSASDLLKIKGIVGKTVSAQDLKFGLERAIERAITLSTQTARALDQNPRDPKTRALFREIFGPTPEYVPGWRSPGAPWKDRGALVSLRLKSVIKYLGSGKIRYYCWGCPGGDVDPMKYAACNYPVGSPIIGLGKLFWEDWAANGFDRMGMVLVHEVLHMIYPTTITKLHKGRFGNAYCYQRFVPELIGLRLYSTPEDVCPSILRFGSRGPEVVKAKHMLNNWIRNLPLQPDRPDFLQLHDRFDQNMVAVVLAYQNFENLRKADGIIGDQTWKVLIGYR